MQQAELMIIRQVQAEAFPKQSQSRHQMSKKRSFCMLDLFLDDDNVLRVEGRIKGAAVPIGVKHPILLHVMVV